MFFGTETLEIGILHGIQDLFSCSFMDGFMVFLSVIGNYGIVWIVCGFVLVCSKKYRRSGIMLLAGLLLCLLIGNIFMKNLIERPRPFRIETVDMLIAIPEDYSFPSGHTLSSFVAAFVLLDANRKFGIVALSAAVLIAFSRMYLFVHFPTDILGGVVLAFLVFVLMKGLSRLRKTEQKTGKIKD